MAQVIMTFFGESAWNSEAIETVHNYINFEDKIIRKGAVSAHEGERLVIPFNMRDGVIVCKGKGNKKWNYSAPHGAGRILSRRKAKETLSMEEFKSEMEGIYTTTATLATLDESPMAYKDKDVIIEAIQETVEIEFFMKPVYNFKAGGE
jgi:RNA-splicing ligase RtcB